MQSTISTTVAKRVLFPAASLSSLVPFVLQHQAGVQRSPNTTTNLLNSIGSIQRRFLNLHEYQSKQILREFGLNVQKGGAASTVEEAKRIAQELNDGGAQDIILKCQVLAGGRGKGTLSSGLKGGVKICKTPDEVANFARNMLGFRLVTHQTTSEGELVNKVLVLEGVDIVKELYVAVVLDGAAGGPVVVASRKGGVDIEEVARTDPDAVLKVPLKSTSDITREECLKIAGALGLDSYAQAYPLNVCDQIHRLVQLFNATDATVVEINPLAVTSKCTDHLVCVDAKLNFDDNAAYRQERITAMEDKSLLDPREILAGDAGLSFVAMDGDIGCLVNGAGLAMATMDIVKLWGGNPANFLDVGGGAGVSQVTEAFRILQSDPNVKVLFVNIFGGIMRCDIIAEGLVEAAKVTGMTLPLVVRLVGNRVEEGKQILKASGIHCTVIDSLEDAAKEACRIAKGAAPATTAAA